MLLQQVADYTFGKKKIIASNDSGLTIKTRKYNTCSWTRNKTARLSEITLRQRKTSGFGKKLKMQSSIHRRRTNMKFILLFFR